MTNGGNSAARRLRWLRTHNGPVVANKVRRPCTDTLLLVAAAVLLAVSVALWTVPGAEAAYGSRGAAAVPISILEDEALWVTTPQNGVQKKFVRFLPGQRPIREETCNPCPTGTYSPKDYKNCSTATTTCDPGFCVNITLCLTCPPGQWNDQANASMCMDCGEGYVGKLPATGCAACRAGQYSSPNRTFCLACPAGTHNPIPTGTCEPCPEGTFAPRMSKLCIPCPAGTFNDEGERGECQTCPSGYYCPEATVDPYPCPSDHYCPEGSEVAQECPLLFKASSVSSSCHPGLVFYIMIGAGAALVVVIGLAIWLIVSRRRHLWRAAKRAVSHDGSREPLTSGPRHSVDGGVIHDVIPKPLPGPVYTGL